jgi:hypothetical protein
MKLLLPRTLVRSNRYAAGLFEGLKNASSVGSYCIKVSRRLFLFDTNHTKE